jgi:hypothetical protein
MKWIQKNVEIKGVTFEARYCLDVEDDRRVDDLYTEEAATARAQGDAWFLFRPFAPLVPTGKTFNGVPSYKAESMPSELWHIKNCSLSDSIEIAIQHFNSPRLERCLHGEDSRAAIWSFLNTEQLVNRVALALVCETALTFELLPEAPKLKRAEATRSMDFCLEQFKCGDDAQERAAMIGDHVQMGVFCIGSV